MDAEQTHSVRIKQSKFQKVSEFSGTSFENCNQTLDETRSQHSQNAPSNALSGNVCQASQPKDETLILRDLSKTDEVFCINLSDSNAPVVKRKCAISVEEYFQELTLPKDAPCSRDNRGIALEFER